MTDSVGRQSDTDEHVSRQPTLDALLADGDVFEEDMHTDSEEDEQDDGRMQDDFGMDQAFPWGRAGEDADGAAVMEEPGQQDDMAEPGLPEPGFNDRLLVRNMRAWHLRGQLGGLPEFVRMLLPVQQGGARERRTNDDLVRMLKRNSSISCKNVIKAFQVCSRDIFVPEDQRDEAFHDHPLRLDHDFNISAPHMHACMIQGLKVQEGDHILDIGSGCGVTAAMLAYMTGKGGRVVGVELRDSALALSNTAIGTMTKKPEYAQKACAVTFERGNAFMLPQHEGKFDKVHVGGLCEMHKIPTLLKLLRPEGGKLVVPSGPELLCISHTEGKLSREVLAHVRFGELEMPSDAEIVMSHLAFHRERSFAPEAVPSPFEEEMDTLLPAGSKPVSTPPSAQGPLVSDEDELEVRSTCTCGSFGPSSRGSLTSRSCMGRASFSSAGSPQSHSLLWRSSPPSVCRGVPSSHQALPNSGVAFGAPDCVVRGAEFELPAHSSVLKARCPLIRAQFDSGMRDADAREVTLPPHFAEAPVRACLDYLYSDTVSLTEDTALPALSVAVYLSISRLIALCSQCIITHLRSLPVADGVESAAQLHVFAREHGLDALCRFCASFLAVHIGTARAAPSYKHLGAKELDEVLEALAMERELVVTRLENLSCGFNELSAELSPKTAS